LVQLQIKVAKRRNTTWEWKINLYAIYNNIENIASFPEYNKNSNVECLFLKGELSNRLKEEYQFVTKKKFPNQKEYFFYSI